MSELGGLQTPRSRSLEGAVKPIESRSVPPLSSPFSVVITHGGRRFLATMPMAVIFLDHARGIVEQNESELVTLAHGTGVELLLVTSRTPITAHDTGSLPSQLLWVSPARPTASGPNHKEPTEGLELTSVRQQILASAYPLIVGRGVKDLSWEVLEDAAGLPRSAIEREFGSRDELLRQCLDIREREWTFGKIRAGAWARATAPEERLLAIFDVFDEWFRRDDFEACTFIAVLVEMGKSHPLGRSSIEHLANIRSIIAALATEANLTDPDEFALSFHVLMKGAIINATEGDMRAALRAKEMGRDLIARFRRP